MNSKSTADLRIVRLNRFYSHETGYLANTHVAAFLARIVFSSTRSFDLILPSFTISLQQWRRTAAKTAFSF